MKSSSGDVNPFGSRLAAASVIGAVGTVPAKEAAAYV